MAVTIDWVIFGERQQSGERPCVQFGFQPGGDEADPRSYSLLPGDAPALRHIAYADFLSEIAPTLPGGVVVRVEEVMSRKRALAHVQEDAGIASAQEVLDALRAARLVVHRV